MFFLKAHELLLLLIFYQNCAKQKIDLFAKLSAGANWETFELVFFETGTDVFETGTDVF